MEIDKNSLKLKYNIEQVYLEIGRAIINQAPIYKIPSPNKDQQDLSQEANIGFAIASISCVFSYAAIEAFTNIQLYRIKIRGDNLHYKVQTVGQKLNYSENEIKKHFEDEKHFNKLIEKTGLQDKLEILSSLLNLDPIEKQNPKLWIKFKEILKDYRHFIIHPKPYPNEFQKKMDKIMIENKLGVYIETAEEIIGYFFKGIKPKWLTQNTIFTFLGLNQFKKLYDKNSTPIKSI